MRDDETAMKSVIAKRRQNRGKMTAVDDLGSYEEVAETHVAGLQKLIPAFQALYDTMSPDQKKNADAAFGHAQGRGRIARQAPQQQ
jgi:periplasmic protein CpxP/Spy